MFPGYVHPFTCVIAGPTQSGKTIFIRKLLKAPHLFITPAPEKIIWGYGVKNEKQMEEIEAGSRLPVEFVEGTPDLTQFSPNQNNLLILDDLMNDVGKNKAIADLFTKGCHHKNISVILVLQNLFHKASEMRDIHTSCNYMVIFKNPRDSAQISYLERQCFPFWKGYLVQSYHHACTRPFGYLVLDLKQSTPSDRRLMSGIFPPEVFFYYHPKM